MGVWKDKKGRWEYKFNHLGQTYRKRGFKNRTGAIRAEADKRTELNAPQIQIPSVSFQEVATMYLDDCWLRMQDNTVRQKSFVYHSFLEFLGYDPAVASVSKSKMAEFLKTAKKATQYNRWLRDMKALFNWAIDHEHVDRSPCRGIKPLPEDPFVKYVPPAEDWNKVKLVADRNEQDFLETMYHLGARLGELVRLTWEDVNFERGTVRLLTRKRRGGALEEDFLPINKPLMAILGERWKKRDKSSPHVFQFTPQERRYMMVRLCEKAEVKMFTFHSIRHRAASVINDSGKASIKDIQMFLRQRRQTTTEIYLHSLDRGAVAAAEILETENEKWDTMGHEKQGNQKNGKD